MFIGVIYTLKQLEMVKQYTIHHPPPQELQHLHTHGHIQHTKHQQINIIGAEYNAHQLILEQIFLCIAMHLNLV
jgi:hypothetical protein